jgi:hypothetical protein
MPLKTGKSDKTFKQNVKTEYEAGKPLKQSLAIAYSMKKKSKKYAEGGNTEAQTKQLKRERSNYENTQAKRGESYGKVPGVHAPSYSSGKDQGQSIAGDLVRRAPSHKKTEYSEATKNEHKRVLGEMKSQKTGYFSEGGQIKDNYQSKDADHFQFTGKSEDPQAECEKSELPGRKHVAMAMYEDDRDLNQHGEHEEGRQGNEGHYAEGGEMEDPKDPIKDNRLEPHQCEGEMCTHKCHNEEHEEDKVGKMAEGGQITDNYADTEDGDGQDMVGRIMKMRQQEYSEGGRVANEAKSNRGTDYLATDDDLEQSYTGANSGDELSSPGEDERRRDIVSKIMASRKKKDRLPNPR